MNKNRYLFWFSTIFLFLFTVFQPQQTIAQKLSTEELLKEKAENLFLDQDYSAAAPLYSQLLSNYPKDPLYNFRYGVCVLFTEKNKDQATSFLEAANGKNRVGPEVFFFLGRAYQMNFRFDEAISMFERFKNEAPKKMRDKLKPEKFIAQTNTAKSLFLVSGKIDVQDTLKVPLSSLFSAYDFSALEGRILATPEKYRTSIDKKKNANRYLYYSKNSELILFASYGSSGKQGSDIYMVHKISNGEWAKPILLDTKINSSEDEAYPFITPDGNTIYFCSKGHNSIGGYDIFRVSKTSKNQWSEPENMGIPVNSPLDDIFFVSDNSSENAFFASDRENIPGLFNIFKVKIKKRKAEFVLIKGNFINTKTNSKFGKISIIASDTKQVVGVYNTNKSSGEYIISLKPGQNYEFILQEKGGTPHSKLIFIPEPVNSANYTQKIKIQDVNGKDEMSIENDFNGLSSEVLASSSAEPENINEQFLEDPTFDVAFIDDSKKNESIAVGNTNESQNNQQSEPIIASKNESSEDKNIYPIKNTENSSENNVNLNSETPISNSANLSNKDIVSRAFSEAADLEQEADVLFKDADIASVISAKKDSISIAKSAESKKLENLLTSLSSEQEKERTRERIARLKQEAAERAKEAEVARTMAIQGRIDAKMKKREAQEAYELAKSYERAAQPVASVKVDKSKKSKLTYNDRLKLSMSSKKEKSDDLLVKGRKLQKQADSLKVASAKAKEMALQSSGDAKAKGLKNAMRLQEMSDIKQKEADLSFTSARMIGDSLLLEEQKIQIAMNISKEVQNASAQEAPDMEIDASEIQTDNVNLETAKNEIPDKDNTDIAKENLALIKPQNTKNTEIQKTSTAIANTEKNDIAGESVIETNNNVLLKNNLIANEKYDNKSEVPLKNIQNDNNIEPSLTKEDELIIAGLQKESNLNRDKSVEIRRKAVSTKNAKEKQKLHARADSIESIASLKLKQAKNYKSEKLLAAANASKFEQNAGGTDAEKLILKLQNESIELKSKVSLNRKKAQQSVNNREKKKLYQEADSLNTIANAKLEKIELYKNNPEILKSDLLAVELQNLNKTEEYNQGATVAVNDVSINKERNANDEKKTIENTQNSPEGNVVNESKSEGLIYGKIYDQSKNEDSSISPEAVKIVKKELSPEEIKAIAKPEFIEYQKLLKDSFNLMKEKTKVIASIQKTEIDIEQNEEKKKIPQFNQKLINTELKISNNFLTQLKSSEKVLNLKLSENKNKINSSRQKFHSTGLSQYHALAVPRDTVSIVKPLASKSLSPLQKNRDENVDEATFNDARFNMDAENTDVVVQSTLKIKENGEIDVEANEKQSDKNKLDDIAVIPQSNVMPKSSEPEIQKEISNKISADNTSFNTQNKISEQDIAVIRKDEKEYVNADTKIKSDKQNENTAATLDTINEKISQKVNDDLAVNTVAKINLQNSTETKADKNSIAQESLAENFNTQTQSENVSANENIKVEISKPEKLQNIKLKKEKQRGEEYINRVVASIDESKLIKSKPSYKKYISLKNDVLSLRTDIINQIIELDKLDIEIENLANEADKHREIASQNNNNTELNKRELSIAVKTEKTLNAKQKNYNKISEKLGKLNTLAETKSNDLMAIAISILPTAEASVASAKQQKINAEYQNKESTTELEEPEKTNTDVALNINADKENIRKTNKEVNQPETPSKPFNQGEYNNLKKELESGKMDAAALFSKSIDAGIESKKLSDLAKQEKVKSNTAKSKSEKQKWLKRSIENENKASELAKKAEDYENQANKIVNDARIKDNELIAMQQSSDSKNAKTDGTQQLQNSLNQNSKSFNLNPLLDNNVEASQLIKQASSVFLRTDKSVYNASNPIPIEESLPSGLIFKVQIGAFRNEIKQDLFKGIQPIVGERTGRGIIRYTAGLFRAFESADLAKKEIRSLGFRDAFIVAYLNGKRIPLYEAADIIAQSTPDVRKEYDSAKNTEIQTLATFNVFAEKFRADGTVNKNAENSLAAAKSNIPYVPSIASLVPKNSMYYTVQVGVYRNPEPPVYMKKIQPVYRDEAGRGLYRYSSGIFANRLSADSSKKRILPIVKDAFVVVFRNGKKISLDEAKNFDTANNTDIPTIRSFIADENPDANTQKETFVAVSDETPAITPQSAIKSTEIPVFKVQIGAYRKEVPIGALSNFLKIKDAGISQSTADDNLTYFFLGGDISSYPEAQKMKQLAQNSGIADAFITAYSNGKKISVQQAMEMLKK